MENADMLLKKWAGCETMNRFCWDLLKAMCASVLKISHDVAMC